MPLIDVQPNCDIKDQDMTDRKLQNKPSKTLDASPLILSAPNERQQKKSRKSTSMSKALSIPLELEQQMTSSSHRHLPLIVGNTYLKVENINLNELMVTPL